MDKPKTPLWYTVDDIRAYLKRTGLSAHHLNELCKIYSENLQASYEKGLEHGEQLERQIEVEPLKREIERLKMESYELD